MSIVKALDLLRQAEVFLASGSLRRREILRRMNIGAFSHLAIPESVENLDPTGYREPRDYVLANIKNKLDYALEHMEDRMLDSGKEAVERSGAPGVVVVADTVVVDGQEILEKPTSAADNYRMIKQLSGKSHKVITAVSFIIPRKFLSGERSPTEKKLLEMKDTVLNSARTFTVETKVMFMPLNDEMISWYVQTGEGEGKAGGYAIQGVAQGIVESVEGCFYNVVGFPIHQFLVELNNELNNLPAQ